MNDQPSAQGSCAFCDEPILETADKTTIQGVAYQRSLLGTERPQRSEEVEPGTVASASSFARPGLQERSSAASILPAFALGMRAE